MSHLLMYALEQEQEAAGDEWQLARRLRGTRWHPTSDVLTAAVEPVTRARKSAAARALARLEHQRLVKVTRDGRNVRAYQLTPSGRTRAHELIEHGGVTAATAARKARERTRQAQPLDRLERAAAARAHRQELQAALSSLSSPLLRDLLRAPVKSPPGGEPMTYGQVSPQDQLGDFSDPVDRYIVAQLQLGWLKSMQRGASKSAVTSLEAPGLLEIGAWILLAINPFSQVETVDEEEE